MGDKEAYNKQRNYCVSFIRKTKQDYCNNLDHRKVPNNKSFLKSIKPLFSDKGSNFNKITLVENDSILVKNDDIAETSLRNRFSNKEFFLVGIFPYLD